MSRSSFAWQFFVQMHALGSYFLTSYFWLSGMPTSLVLFRTVQWKILLLKKRLLTISFESQPCVDTNALPPPPPPSRNDMSKPSFVVVAARVDFPPKYVSGGWKGRFRRSD